MALRGEHYLADTLRDLFEAERRSYQRVVDALRRASSEVTPPPLSAWVEGATDYAADTGTLVLTVVVEADRAAAAAEQLTEGVRELRQEFELPVSPRVLTRADVAAGVGPGDGADLILLVGPHPGDFLSDGKRRSEPTKRKSTRISGPARHDTRQLRLATALAERQPIRGASGSTFSSTNRPLRSAGSSSTRARRLRVFASRCRSRTCCPMPRGKKSCEGRNDEK